MNYQGLLEQNYLAWANTQARFDQQFTPTLLTGNSIYLFDAGDPMPVFMRTGDNGCGAPMALKFFRGLRMYGDGALQVRVYVDRKLIATGLVDLTEVPRDARSFGIPRGTKGYCIDVEFCGYLKYLRALEIDWDPVGAHGGTIA